MKIGDAKAEKVYIGKSCRKDLRRIR